MNTLEVGAPESPPRRYHLHLSRTERDLDLDGLTDRVAQTVLSAVVADPERWREAYERRRGWGYEKATYDAAGRIVGVTRERVRQVVGKADAALNSLDPVLPWVLADAVAAVDWDDPGDVQATLVDLGLVASSRQWTAAGLLDLLRCCGHGDLADAAEERMRQGSVGRRITPEQRKAIRAARSLSGVLDMRLVDVDGERLPVQEVARLVPQVYSDHVIVGDWALCGAKDGTAVENAATAQLAVAGELGADELFEGISRTCRKRSWPVPPSAVVMALLRAKGTVGGPDDALTLGPNAVVHKLGGNDAWLVDLLQSTSEKMLPVAEVLRRARATGANSVSIRSTRPTARSCVGPKALCAWSGRRLHRLSLVRCVTQRVP